MFNSVLTFHLTEGSRDRMVVGFTTTYMQSVPIIGTSVSSTNKNDRHYITELMLKVALNTITLTPNPNE